MILNFFPTKKGDKNYLIIIGSLRQFNLDIVNISDVGILEIVGVEGKMMAIDDIIIVVEEETVRIEGLPL